MNNASLAFDAFDWLFSHLAEFRWLSLSWPAKSRCYYCTAHLRICLVISSSAIFEDVMVGRLFSVARHLSNGSRLLPTSHHVKSHSIVGASALQMRSMATTHPTAGKRKGQLPGFSFPGPRNLDSIVKVQLLQKHGTPRVREIWDEFHKSHKTAIGDSLNSKEHSMYMNRTKRCSFFVLPVPR